MVVSDDGLPIWKGCEMASKTIFAENLSRLIRGARLTIQDVADQVGMKPKTLYRWVEEGITKADRRTQEKLDALCEFLNITADSLWKEHSSRAGICADKVREMVEIWERTGVASNWIDAWHISARVAERFRREEKELCERVRRVKDLDSDARLHQTLEKQVREMAQVRALTESQALSQLRQWAIEQ